MKKLLLNLLLVISAVFVIWSCQGSEADTTSLTLTWTAPYDDIDHFFTGHVAAYDVRYTTDTAMPYLQWSVFDQAMTPQPAGAMETLVVDGLIPSTEYWFVVRSSDYAGNLSEWSNVATKRTSDGIPPDKIEDLEANE